MKQVVRVVIVVTLTASAFAGDAAASKLTPQLTQALQTLSEGQRVRVNIEFASPFDSEQLVPLAESVPDKAARRAVVVAVLESIATSAQHNVLEWLRSEAARGEVDQIRPLWIVNVISAEVTAGVARALAVHPDVERVSLDARIGEMIYPYEEGEDDPLAEIECGVDVMQAPRVWSEFGIRGVGAKVAVIDSGLCLFHPDYQKQVWANPGEIPGNGIDDDHNGYIDDINGWNFSGTGNNNISDSLGHGTHVSGTVAGDGTGGTQTGMAPGCRFAMLKISGSFSGEAEVWNAMQYAVLMNFDLTTASLGWPLSQNPNRAKWRQACENTIAAGLVVIYAAGNEGDKGQCAGNGCPIRCPGDVPSVITVGATNCSDAIASFSSRGNVTWVGVQGYNDHPCPPGYLKPTISAPGENTKSTRRSTPCSGYTNMSGTSMATPHVAGCVALMLEANPALTHAQVKQILKDTAKDLGDPGPDRHFGAGRVDCYEAVRKARELAGKKGDLNCDGVVNFGDINPFVLALSNPDEYKRQYPNCDIKNGDCNNDGKVDFGDINPFVELIGR